MTSAASQPLVSVVIPCFNQARFLPTSLGSVFAQTWRAVEAIVVDDGSTDDTAEVAALLGATVMSQPNRGLSEARNAGLSAARGEYVVFLDADDELLTEALEAGVAALEATPEAALSVGRCLAMDADGRPLPAPQYPVDPDHLYAEWLVRNFVWTPGAAMFRRGALQDLGGFPAGLGPAADYALYLQLARRGAVVYQERNLVRYRQHAASMSRDCSLMLRTTLQALRRERATADPVHRPAIRRGERAWRTYYGEEILENLKMDLAAGRFGRQQADAAWVLLRHAPGFIARRAVQKLRRPLGVSAATPPNGEHGEAVRRPGTTR
ncbi:MAG TPA: glycosyltransferase [Vicinamibacterales bacterium]|nr:glycosyltransferase [Vicinamibacterales bacterium]